MLVVRAKKFIHVFFLSVFLCQLHTCTCVHVPLIMHWPRLFFNEIHKILTMTLFIWSQSYIFGKWLFSIEHLSHAYNFSLLIPKSEDEDDFDFEECWARGGSQGANQVSLE